QYALMNMAVLQADFGCFREALTAMLESVSIAREKQDAYCLNFALSWLYHFGLAHPRLVTELEPTSIASSAREGLAYLRVKARETGMWSLWSSALLSEAKMGMAAGESVATAAELMVRSSQIIVERNLANMLGSQAQLQVALWTRLGLSD